MGNNPVLYSDPNGDFIPAMLLGAGIGLLTNGISNVVQGNNFFQGGLQAAGLGAIGGGVSFGIGQAAAGISNGFGRAAFQVGAHGLSGGAMSAALGGSFGSGFLSGALSSGMSSGASAAGIGNAGMIGIGGLTGGIGSSIGGGSFWNGVGQGLITSGLNHAAHSGAFGDNIAASLITGRVRHMFGPDARHYTVGGEIGVAPLFEAKVGEIEILRGPQKGRTSALWEYGVGGGLDMGAGAGVTKLYYSGSTKNIRLQTFTGRRTQFTLGGSIGVELSGSVSYSRTRNNHFVLGIGYALGVGLGISPYPGVGISGNINYGSSFIPQK